MAKAKRKRAKRRLLRGRGADKPDLKAVSRAQLGPDPEQRAYRPQPYDASVQDPLRDWPEED